MLQTMQNLTVFALLWKTLKGILCSNRHQKHIDLSCETSLDTESFEIEASFLDSELSSFAPRVMTVRVFVRLSPTRSVIVVAALDLLRVHGPTEEALSLLAVEELFSATLLDN
ncbi:hypothetical protein ACH5RR_001268 [Cinchona calisaya]|uniref:Secreted protein n=1 Tax=Cinchona calisaya TaxID=153742 RepID=A0ABD3B2X0_9GENT